MEDLGYEDDYCDECNAYGYDYFENEYGEFECTRYSCPMNSYKSNYIEYDWYD